MKKTDLYRLIKEDRIREALFLLASELPPEERITTPLSVTKLISAYADKEQEHFGIIALDGAGQPISTEVISFGLVNRTIVHPREVFRKAMLLNATSIILWHNHPSGCVESSPEDRGLTERLIEASKIIGISILDHIIIGQRNGVISYTSMVELHEGGF